MLEVWIDGKSVYPSDNDIEMLPVDDCPAGCAMNFAVAGVMKLEQLHWGSTQGSWGTLGFMRPEEEGEAYCLWSECNEIAPIPASSTSRTEALILVDALCAAGFGCVLEYGPRHGFQQVTITNPELPVGEVIIKIASEALAICRAYLKVNGATRIARGPHGF